jgi:hypothetical protein
LGALIKEFGFEKMPEVICRHLSFSIQIVRDGMDFKKPNEYFLRIEK